MKSRTLLLLDSNGLQKRYVFDCCGFLFYCNFIFLPQDSSNCRRIVIHISHLSYSEKKTLWQQNDNFHKSSSLRTGYQANLKVCGIKNFGQLFFIKNQKFIMFKAYETFVWCLKDHFYAIYGRLKKKEKKKSKKFKVAFLDFF